MSGCSNIAVFFPSPLNPIPGEEGTVEALMRGLQAEVRP
jgi:hypothetical protein